MISSAGLSRWQNGRKEMLNLSLRLKLKRIRLILKIRF